MAITGVYALLYSEEPEALQAFFRDVFGSGTSARAH